MKTRWLALAALLLSAVSVYAAAPGDSVKPEEGMPLALYQKIKAHFTAMYGPKASLLPGVKPKGKEELEAALREDVSANKDVLIQALAKGTPLHRDLAAAALEYCADKKAAIEALCKALEDSDENVRRASAAALAKLPDAVAVDSLVKALGDSNDGVRGICAAALGNIKDNRAAEPLLRVLGGDANPMVRMQSATALSKIKEPATQEPLTKLMESEKDERVRMAIAGAIRNIMGGDNAQTEPVPTVDQAAAELAALANEMKEVEDKLRGDRHDQSVQVQGGGIEQKLAQLIEKLDKSGGKGSSEEQEKKEKQSQQKQQSKGQGQGGGSNPLADSKPSGGTPPGALSAAQVAAKQDDWSKLPPALREAMLQTQSEGVPILWQSRIKAYILSINAEEVKDVGK
jgi:HEAT repeat protein